MTISIQAAIADAEWMRCRYILPVAVHVAHPGLRRLVLGAMVPARPIEDMFMARDVKPVDCDDDADKVKTPAGHPPPEDELGGGDICSLEEAPSTEDDAPLP